MYYTFLRCLLINFLQFVTHTHTCTHTYVYVYINTYFRTCSKFPLRQCERVCWFGLFSVGTRKCPFNKVYIYFHNWMVHHSCANMLKQLGDFFPFSLRSLVRSFKKEFSNINTYLKRQRKMNAVASLYSVLMRCECCCRVYFVTAADKSQCVCD